MLGDAETTPLPDSPHPPTPSPVPSPDTIASTSLPITEALPELLPPHTTVTLPDPMHAVLHYELVMRGIQPIILPTNTFINTPMDADPYVADALRSPSPPPIPIPALIPSTIRDSPLDCAIWQPANYTSSAGPTPSRLSTTSLYLPTELVVTQAPTRQWQNLWDWTHKHPAPPPQTATLPAPPLSLLHFTLPNALGEQTAGVPPTELDAWSDTHKLMFTPLPGKLYLPNGREQLLHIAYRYMHGDGSITHFIGKITYNTTRVLAYLHTLHTLYLLYYFWKGQDLVTLQQELQKFIELYCKHEGVPAGADVDGTDEEDPPHINPSKEIAHVQLPHASALIEHYHKVAVEGIPFTAYLAKLEDPIETHTFEFIIYFFPQNPTLAYYVHKTDEDGNKVTDQVATFDCDEEKNEYRYQELTSLERLALVLFVLPVDAFKKYRRTGKLNVFRIDVPTFRHLEQLDHYRPVLLHLSVVANEHPSITSLFA